ncbi:MAG: isochorismatase family protein [Nocardioides sp.]|uniref:isochorismatase family protein n=1 Tax=Nocardioides sp. TaxID=35761 RepID=UPI0039E48DF8
MTLPSLIDYEPPTPPHRELPEAKAEWVLDPSRAAVLVHDMQRYFVRVFDPCSPALTRAVERIGAVLAAARAAGVPVLYTAQTGEHLDRGLQGELWGPGMSPVPEHTEILPELAPRPGETVLDKRRYSAFARTDLGERLAAAGRDQLVLTGVYAHIGVTATAFDGFCRDVRPFLVADAVADLSIDKHAHALEVVAGCCGVVTSADRVITALAPAAPVAAVSGPGDPTRGWSEVVLGSLTRLLGDEAVAGAQADPGADLFALGLNSLQAFDLLDDLADAGVDLDFGDFTRHANLEYLLAQGAVPAR